MANVTVAGKKQTWFQEASGTEALFQETRPSAEFPNKPFKSIVQVNQ